MSQYKTEKAVFVGVVLEKGGERKTQEYLEELRFLAETAGAIGDKMFTQRLDRPDKATYIGPVSSSSKMTYWISFSSQYSLISFSFPGPM